MKHSYIIAVDADTEELRVSRVRTKDAKEIGSRVFKTYQQAVSQLNVVKVLAKAELDRYESTIPTVNQ